MKYYDLFAPLTLVISMLIAGCSREPQLRIAAASDLRPVMPELIAAFERTSPGVRVEAVFGASGSFVAQVTSGGPFDVFMSADEQYPKALIEAGRARSLTRYATGSLVLFIHASVVESTQALIPGGYCAILTSEGITTVAIADPRTAPYGRAALAAIRACAESATIESKLVFADNVSHTAQLGETGAAQAAIISGSLGNAPALRAAGSIVPVPQTAYPPIIQAAAVVTSAGGSGGERHEITADAWIEFLASSEARAILAAHGFGGVDHTE